MNMQNDMLHTTLYMFISRPPQNEYVLDKLFDAGANPDISRENGYSPRHVLAIESATEKTKTFSHLLVKYKVNVDSETEFKETPLHFAVNEGNIGLVEVMVRRGASINIANLAGITPMDIALAKRTRYSTVFDCLAEHLNIQYCCGFSVNLRYLEEVCNSESYQNQKRRGYLTIEMPSYRRIDCHVHRHSVIAYT
ncbi:hypothetical protein WA026_022970 [Henosepilachna vigintioctopunctata]|uniref:Uncharacterized protein n=1 Tax=Henosepilachna vigintioctopunctata TaxID=420089 RepID=A0AAW1TZL8_9CUCU